MSRTCSSAGGGRPPRLEPCPHSICTEAVDPQADPASLATVGADDLTFTYDPAACTSTAGAYRLKPRDRGKKVTVQVTGTRPAYAAVVRASAAERVR